jgi:Uncharacterized protein conserved in bacteria (DUF2171)
LAARRRKTSPVAWNVVERGWRVLASDGEDLGTVDELIGDAERDIFNGLSVAHGRLSRPRYVPAEDVAEIREGELRLALDRVGFDRLGDDEPPSGR